MYYLCNFQVHMNWTSRNRNTNCPYLVKFLDTEVTLISKKELNCRQTHNWTVDAQSWARPWSVHQHFSTNVWHSWALHKHTWFQRALLMVWTSTTTTSQTQESNSGSQRAAEYPTQVTSNLWTAAGDEHELSPKGNLKWGRGQRAWTATHGATTSN
jgi:hypothetical protein